MIPLPTIHERIEALAGQLEDLVFEITATAGEAAHAEAEFRAEFAKQRLRARADATTKLTVDAVEDMATEKTQDQRLKYLLKANELLVLREAMRARQAQLDGYRTLAASYRGGGG